jgi:hypothetical protein
MMNRDSLGLVRFATAVAESLVDLPRNEREACLDVVLSAAHKTIFGMWADADRALPTPYTEANPPPNMGDGMVEADPPF